MKQEGGYCPVTLLVMYFLHDIYMCGTDVLHLLHVLLLFPALPGAFTPSLGSCRGEGEHSILGASGPWARTGPQKEKLQTSVRGKEEESISREKLIKVHEWCALC